MFIQVFVVSFIFVNISFVGLSNIKSLVKGQSSVSAEKFTYRLSEILQFSIVTFQSGRDFQYFLHLYIRYSDLVPNEPAGSEAGARSRLVTSSMMSSEMYNEIRGLYITAAQRAPENDIDSNVQASTCYLFTLYCMF